MRCRTLRVLIGAVLLMVVACTPVLAADLANMEFRRAPLVEVLQILGQLGGYNVLVDPSVQGEVSFVLNDLSLEEALDLVTRTTGYRYQLIGNTLVFASEQRLQSEFGNEGVRFVSIEHVSADAARGLISLVVPNVRSFVDTALNLVVLYGIESDLQVAEQILKEYDRQAGRLGAPVVAVAAPEQPQEVKKQVEESEPLVFNAVPVEFAEGAKILEMVRQLLPDREFAFHPESRLLTARTTAEEWETLEMILQRQDIPAFTLKGILRVADQFVAIVEHQGSTYSLKLGEELYGWTLAEVAEGSVKFTRGERSFSVNMGR